MTVTVGGVCADNHVILYPSRKTSVHVRATLPIPWRAQTSFVVWTSAKAKENSTVGGIELPSTQPTIRRTTLSTKNSHSNRRAAENELLFSKMHKCVQEGSNLHGGFNSHGLESVGPEPLQVPDGCPLHRRPIVRALPARLTCEPCSPAPTDCPLPSAL